DLVDALERLGFDSLWLSERITGPAPDPLVGLAVAAGRTRKLKLGTSVMVLPGRNPALVAAEWATLDRLSGGRTLPAFGLGVADPRPGVVATDLGAGGMAALRATLERFWDGGFSKFGVVPLEDAPSWADELAEVGDAVLPLQAGLAAPR